MTHVTEDNICLYQLLFNKPRSSQKDFINSLPQGDEPNTASPHTGQDTISIIKEQILFDINQLSHEKTSL